RWLKLIANCSRNETHRYYRSRASPEVGYRRSGRSTRPGKSPSAGGSGTEGQEMSVGKSSKAPNMTQRAVMQHLSLTDWKLASRLPIPAGEMMLSRMVQQGWIEIQGKEHNNLVRLTEVGL